MKESLSSTLLILLGVAAVAVSFMLIRPRPFTLNTKLASTAELNTAAGSESKSRILAETHATATAIYDPAPYTFIEVLDSCGPSFQGACVNMRSGPGVEYPSILHLRTGVVLKVAKIVIQNGTEWYKIQPDTDILYPERIVSDWYVAADMVRVFYDDGIHDAQKDGDAEYKTTKRIIVDISDQMLYAYNGDILFMQEPISTGLEFTPTPRGTFRVYKMTPSRYMQGPIVGVSDQVFDLPGVPWNLYFTYDGAVIHGAYWHDHFGEPWSHGCVNLPPQKAKELYLWADMGTTVTVKE